MLKKTLTTIAKIKVIQLTDKQRLQLEDGFRRGKSHAFRMRCRAILLKAKGLTSKEVGVQTGMYISLLKEESGSISSA